MPMTPAPAASPWPADPNAPVVLMSVKVIDGRCYVEAEEAHAAVQTARRQGRDQADLAPTARVHATAGAGRMREAAAKWHDAMAADFRGRVAYFRSYRGSREHCSGVAGAEAAALDFARMQAMHVEAAEHLRALALPDADALSAVIAEAVAKEREATVTALRSEADRLFSLTGSPGALYHWQDQAGGMNCAADFLQAAAIRARAGETTDAG